MVRDSEGFVRGALMTAPCAVGLHCTSTDDGDVETNRGGAPDSGVKEPQTSQSDDPSAERGENRLDENDDQGNEDDEEQHDQEEDVAKSDADSTEQSTSSCLMDDDSLCVCLFPQPAAANPLIQDPLRGFARRWQPRTAISRARRISPARRLA